MFITWAIFILNRTYMKQLSLFLLIFAGVLFLIFIVIGLTLYLLDRNGIDCKILYFFWSMTFYLMIYSISTALFLLGIGTLIKMAQLFTV